METEFQPGSHSELDPETILVVLRSKGVLDAECSLTGKLSGTTAGQVHVIAHRGEPAYVLKIDAPEEVEPVTRFLAVYDHVPLLPKLWHVEPTCRYFVYDYLPGIAYYPQGRKAEWLIKLTEQCIGRYERASAVGGWGWTTEPARSWRTFVAERVVEARIAIGTLIADEEADWLMRIVSGVSRYDDVSPFLLHGDCGVHNFIFAAGDLTGIIDPTPVVGPPIYDLLYAFCSSPDELSPGALLPAVALLSQTGLVGRLDEEQIVEELLIQLYCRIATCLKYHSHHLDDYLTAWQFWQSYRAGLAGE